MKSILMFMAALCLVSDKLSAQQPSLSDYKPPVSQEDQFYLNFNYEYDDDRHGSIKDKGYLYLHYKDFYSSLPYSWTFAVNSYNDYNRGSDTNDRSFETMTTASYEIKKYITENSDFYFSGNVISSLYYYTPASSPVISAQLNPGIGYGRFYAVTSFARALRIDEFLLSEGLTTGNLSNDILVELAELIDKWDEYDNKYGHKGSIEWYAALEKLLIKSGKLKDGIVNNYALSRAGEVALYERIATRQVGWDVYSNLLSNMYSYSPEPPRPIEIRCDYLGYRIGCDFGYPLNNKLQLDHSSSYIHHKFYDESMKSRLLDYYISSNTSISYELTNMIDISFEYSFRSQKWKSDIENNQTITHVLQLGFYYYIENNITLRLTSSIKFGHSSGSEYYDNDETIRKLNLSIYYRFF